MTDFSTWSHANLVKFAQDSTEEILHLRQDLRTAIKAYRELIRNTRDVQDLQQLSVTEVQPDGAEHHQPGWPHIQVDLF